MPFFPEEFAALRRIDGYLSTWSGAAREGPRERFATFFHCEDTTMNVRYLAAVVAMLAVVGVAMHQACSADSGDKDEAAFKQASSDFAVRYAKAQLRLAELRLAKARK